MSVRGISFVSKMDLFFAFFLAFMFLFSSIVLCVWPCCAQASYFDEDEDIKTFDGKGTDFSFKYPAIWMVQTASNIHGGKESMGNNAEGSMKINGPCERISLNWTRDPGISPRNILEQIEKTYNSEEVKVLSAKRDTIPQEDSQVEAMSLIYELKGCRSEKRFAVWNSSKSDRLFIASISASSCRPELGQGVALFDSLIASFSDLGDRERLQLGPKIKDDAWTLVLGDLLSSYHYIDTKTLPSRIARIQVLYTLSPINGSYRLDSQEMIHVDLPEIASERAWAVQSLLQKEGYSARLAQRSGEIGVAVQGPTDRWQMVSINPAKPEKSVGVLANGTKEALIYDSLEELAEDNQIEFQEPNMDGLMQKDCEPSRYVDLKQPSDTAGAEHASWLDGLKEVLDGYDYDEHYQENVFDCSNTAQICWSLLQGKGYDARLMMSWKGHPLGPHLWVVVLSPFEEGRYVAVETANTNGDMELVHLGRVVTDDDYYRGIMYNSSAQYSRLHLEEGMWLEKKI